MFDSPKYDKLSADLVYFLSMSLYDSKGHLRIHIAVQVSCDRCKCVGCRIGALDQRPVSLSESSLVIVCIVSSLLCLIRRFCLEQQSSSCYAID